MSKFICGLILGASLTSGLALAFREDDPLALEKDRDFWFLESQRNNYERAKSQNNQVERYRNPC